MAGTSKSARKGWANLRPAEREARIAIFVANRRTFTQEEASRNAREAWLRPGFRENQVLKHLGRRPSLESRLKQSQSRRGHHHSEETRRKISEAHKKRWAALDQRDRARILRSAWASTRRLSANSSLEKAVWAVLNTFGICYQVNVHIGPYYTDVMIPSRNLILECDGEYWHRDSEQYEEKRDQFLMSEGFRVVHLPEAKIKEDAVGIVREALNGH